MKIIEEITLFNDSAKKCFFTYDLGQYRTALEIFDFDGKTLAFHSAKNVVSPGQNKHEHKYTIDIEFPKAKPLLENEYRVVKLQYFVSDTQQGLPVTKIDIALYENANIYSFIKECDGYEFTVDYSLYNSKGKEFNPSILKTQKTPFFYEMRYTSEEISDGNVLITVNHLIPASVLNWATLGLYFGAVSIFSLVFANIWDFLNYLSGSTNSSGSNVSGYLVLASMTISFLGIVKGWMFVKRMEGTLKDYDRDFTKIIFVIIILILVISLRFCSGLISSIILLFSNFPSFVVDILYNYLIHVFELLFVVDILYNYLIHVFELFIIPLILMIGLVSLVPLVPKL